MQHTKTNQILKLQQQPIDFGQLLAPIVKYWYLFVVSIALCVAAASFYLRHVTPIYEVQSTILVRDNERNGLTRDALQKELLGMAIEPKIYEDVRILNSRTLMQEVVDSLNLRHRLLLQQGFGISDAYKSSPIDLATSLIPDLPKNYQLNILNNTQYRIQIGEETYLDGVFGEPLNTPDGIFVLQLKTENSHTFKPASSYILSTNSSLGSASRYLSTFSVQYDINQPTLLNLYLRDEVPERGQAILAEVIKAYNRITSEGKIKTRNNTLSFIDERLELLAKELNEVELDLEQYKSKENLSIDYKTDLPYIQNRIGYFEREIMDIEIQQNIMEYITSTLNDNKYQFFPLVDFGIEHKGLSNLIIEYNALIQERKRLQQTATENHPAIQLAHEKIEALKIIIQEEAIKKQRDLLTKMKELKAKNGEYIKQLAAIPRIERELVNKKRQQLIKENLYTFLLEKREEAALSVAAVAPSGSVVDAPFLVGQVAPKRSSTLLGASLAGFFFPFSVLVLFGVFDRRLRKQEEWTDYTALPVLGSIVKAQGTSKLVIQANNHSPAAESFRALRTNLDFFLKGADCQLVLITSSSIEEGKSFTTINLGMSYALSAKRVLLMDFDLYKPKMLTYLGVHNSERGISDYLAGTVELSEIIHTYSSNKYLDYIPSGSIMPNPSELLMNERLAQLLTELKPKYDIIILDSPAAGLVSDSLRLSKFADASLYIARIGITERADLKLVERLYAEGKLTNAAIVFNGIKKDRLYKRAFKKGYYSRE